MFKGDRMKAIILASGSKGNALIIQNNETKILVDIGISYQALSNKLKDEELNINNIKYVIITHEHSDHIKGLSRFLVNHPHVKVYLSKGTYESLNTNQKKYLINYNLINKDETIEIEGFKIIAFDLSHDASEPLGFVFELNEKKVVLATDTGYIDQTHFNLLKGANLYILEANHEPEMLMNSSRPYYLKQRILGERGHLSNYEAAWLINEFIKDLDKAIWAVAHISEDCNTVYNIEKAIVDVLEDPTKIKVVYTSQESLKAIKL